ncbi:MAG: YdeI/OmpD-associated family protein [Bacteroidia bacterium]|nr:YdeI/OmpD-associated family protein [Bacteroidia bacterium]
MKQQKKSINTNKEETKTFCPKNQKEWRKWLEKNHQTAQAIWVVHYKKESDKPSLTWSDAVDEALCFGWIDSTRRVNDHESYLQFFTKRKPGSMWSTINKEKVARLINTGKMTEAGLKSIELAKQNGNWNMLDELEGLNIPKDLEKEFKKHRGAKDFFLSLSNSLRKSMLLWLVLAKRPETREKRIKEMAELAGQKLKPKQFV